MRNRTVIILVIVAALIIAGIYGWNEYHRGAKSLTRVEAAFNVNAESFITEFEGNEKAAEKKYLGKVVSVTGKIKQVEKDADGDYTIVLGSPSTMSAIRCSMDSTMNESVAALKEGEQVEVKGTFTGYQKDDTGLLGSDIQLNRSVIDVKK